MRGDEAERARLLEAEARVVRGNALDHDGRLGCFFGAAERVPDQPCDRTTTGLYLGWSPIIERIATNRYALRGADVPTGTLEAMRGTSPRTRVQRGYGWTNHGRLWVGYTLSQAVIDSHVVGVPSALKHELCGSYDLAAPNDTLGQLKTDGTNLWGLSRLLKRYAAEAGVALVLEFDLVAREVYSFIGGQELLDPENRPEQVVDESATGTALGCTPDEPPNGGEEAACIADDGAEEAAPFYGEPGLAELRPLRPTLLDRQTGFVRDGARTRS
jgi:hypothetical protein